MGAKFKAYVATMEDLYELTPKNGSYESRSLGLRGKGGVRAVIVDWQRPDRIYAGTARHGVLRSTDGGKTWSEANYGITYKNIFSAAQDAKTGALYVGTEPATLFRSLDGGDSWEDFPTMSRLPETKQWFFPSPPHVAHIRDVAIDPADSDHFLGAVEDGHLVSTHDGGRTWKVVKEGVDEDAHALTFMPDDPKVVFAATGRFGYRSTDGAETFVKASEGLDRGYMAHVAVHPARPNVLITAASKNPPPLWRRPDGPGADLAVFRSEDQGKSWRRVTKGLPELERAGTFAVGGNPHDPDIVFVGLASGVVWATRDGGETFNTAAQLEGNIRHTAFVQV
jgi:photosystem II stability/assembly factor-like uncharacterized protein